MNCQTLGVHGGAMSRTGSPLLTLTPRLGILESQEGSFSFAPQSCETEIETKDGFGFGLEVRRRFEFCLSRQQALSLFHLHKSDPAVG